MNKLYVVLVVVGMVCSVSGLAMSSEINIENAIVEDIQCVAMQPELFESGMLGTKTNITFLTQDNTKIKAEIVDAEVTDGDAKYEIFTTVSNQNNEGLIQMAHTAFITQKRVSVTLIPSLTRVGGGGEYEAMVVRPPIGPLTVKSIQFVPLLVKDGPRIEPIEPIVIDPGNKLPIILKDEPRVEPIAPDPGNKIIKNKTGNKGRSLGRNLGK